MNATLPPCTTAAINDHHHYGFHTACELVQQACVGLTTTVNFFDFYYCDLKENVPTFVLFSIVFVALSFYLFQSTAQDYLEPALTTIAERLHFSESLAGVTLVALANGAPDVFAAFAAGGGSNSDILLPLGALFGAGVFVTTVVLSVCILFSKEGSIKVSSSALTRDCSFYFLAGCWMLYQGIHGTLNYSGAIGLFVIYIVFICVVIFQETRINKAKRQKQQSEQEERKRRPSFEVSLQSEDDSSPMNNSLLSSLLMDQHVPSLIDDLNSPNSPTGSFFESKASFYEGSLEDSSMSVSDPNFIRKRGKKHSRRVKVRFQIEYIKHKTYLELKEIQQKNIVGRILSYAVIPFVIIRNISIPPCTNDRWSKPILLLQPFLCSLFLIWQFGFIGILDSVLAWAIFIILALIVTGILFKVTRASHAPRGIGGLFLIAVAFISACVWINYVANIFVDYTSLLSVFSNFPQNYLGLTLVAWGNSTNDLFVDSALARKGLGQIAASGVVAGQFFNLALGFGATTIRQVISFGPIPFDILAHTHTALVSLILICTLLLSLGSTLIYGYFAKYRLKKPYGIYLGAVYATFFITSTLLIVVFRH